MGRKRKYFTEEERKAAERERKRKWYQSNKENIAEYYAEYYQVNKEKFAEYYQNNKETIAKQQAEWYQHNKGKILEQIAEKRTTPMGKAQMHVDNYIRSDKLYNRGECTLTAEWIVQNIFSKPCQYCGETDWHELGCDRIDNSLPHTPDNVVPCCYHCNCKKGVTPYDEYMKKIGKIA